MLFRSQMFEGDAYFCIARTIQKESFGWHAQPPLLAIGLGCSIEEAHGLVYADGIDLRNERNVVPVGVTCRTCTRTDCTQRAVPSLRGPIRIDEHVRRVSPYTA